MNVQTVEIEGKKYAFLPYENFQKIADDLELADDLNAYYKAKANEEEYFPAELVYAVLDGENPIKVYREYRELTLATLSKAAGISQAYLCQIETGKRTGSVAVLKRIATALGVDLEDIVIERETS